MSIQRKFQRNLSRRLIDVLSTAGINRGMGPSHRYLAFEPITQPYFGLSRDAPAEAFEAEVPTHPVFKLTPVSSSTLA